MNEKREFTKQWGVDLYTDDQLEIKIRDINTQIEKFQAKGHDTPLTRRVIKMRDAFVKELELRKFYKQKAHEQQILEQQWREHEQWQREQGEID